MTNYSEASESSPPPSTPQHQPAGSFSVHILGSDHTVSDDRAAPNQQDPTITSRFQGGVRELASSLLGPVTGVVWFTVINNKLEPTEEHFILICLAVGFAAVLLGNLLEHSSSKSARIFVLLGITLLVISFFTTIAFFLPKDIVWIPGACITALSVVAFVIAKWPSAPSYS